jgi:hypothetical protein
MMAYFTVYTTQEITESTVVEADTQEQAHEIVLNDTGSLDWQFVDSDGWQIESIIKRDE